MRALEALHLTLKMLKSVRSPRRGELHAAAELLAPCWARGQFTHKSADGSIRGNPGLTCFRKRPTINSGVTCSRNA